MSRNPVPDEITSLRKFQHETEVLIIKDDILYLIVQMDLVNQNYQIQILKIN